MSEIELWWWLDTNMGSNDGGKEVSAEDIVRVNESLGEARKYRGRIASSVASNSKIAAFISYLFLVIEDDSFWDELECFWIPSELGESSFIVKIFVACMLPLYEEKSDELWLDKEFPLDYHFVVTFQSYLLYVQQVFAHDAEGRKVDEKKLKSFLKKIIEIWDIKVAENDSIEQFKVLPF